MGALLAQTVPLAFAAAISPLVMMGILEILAGAHATRNGVAYTLGVMGMTGVIIVVGLVLVAHRAAKTSGSTSVSWVDAVIGAALIGVAVWMVWPRTRTDAERAHGHKIRAIGPTTPAVAYTVLGAALMILNGSTIIVLIAILRNVSRAGQAAAYDAVAMLIVWLIATVPAWGPLVLVLAGGASMATRVTRLGAWTNRNGKYILGALFFVFGLQDLLKFIGH